MEAWGLRWNTESWHAYLEIAQEESDLIGIRDCTCSGRPLGSLGFTRALEKEAHRVLTPQKRGLRSSPDPLPSSLLFSSTLFNLLRRCGNGHLHGSDDKGAPGNLSLVDPWLGVVSS